jgi:hypothetical protein
MAFLSELERSLARLGLATQDVTLLSHTHGRQRREERCIERAELQAAVKYGRKERAHAGRDGSQRWRFTHKGVVYITDATGRHEVTSWRLEDAAPPPCAADAAGGGGAGFTSHTVLVVDRSGSMRRADVPDFATRTAAVYDCLAREFVQPQLDVTRGDAHAGAAVVTLVEMGEQANVLLTRAPVDEALLAFFKQRGASRAASHGNYLPTLDAVVDVLREDAGRDACRLFLVFLSDGAPSDHVELPCEHGVCVWQPAPGGLAYASARGRRGLLVLEACVTSQACRAGLKQHVQEECLKRVQLLGDLFGRDRMCIHTVAFGDPGEDYGVLERMAGALPRSSFQKLGLAAASLKTAFTSLSTSLATLRTDGAGAPPMTRRAVRQEAAPASPEAGVRRSERIMREAGWHTYTGYDIVYKRRFDHARQRFVDVPLAAGASGVAVFSHKFAEGVERYAFRCTEISGPGYAAAAVGEWLVAKETLFVEQLQHASFHERMAKVQAQAEALAARFNERVRGAPAWHVRFVECCIYEVLDASYDGGMAWILAEAELEGAFTKWNNNNGAVRSSRASRAPQPQRAAAGLGAIHEDDEEGDGEDEEDEDGAEDDAVRDADIPQCFSHFTWSVTDGDILVCDLQGVWNALDGFTLTDPAMHRSPRGGRARKGATDKGQDGIDNFFKTHKCSALCRRLGLKAPGEGAQRAPRQRAR